MSKGRSICNVLKAVRKAVADANGIEYEPRKCYFTGECKGTCPACEAEVRYVEREIAIRRLAGKAVTVAGIAAGALSLTACGDNALEKKAETLLEQARSEFEHGDYRKATATIDSLRKRFVELTRSLTRKPYAW